MTFTETDWWNKKVHCRSAVFLLVNGSFTFTPSFCILSFKGEGGVGMWEAVVKKNNKKKTWASTVMADCWLLTHNLRIICWCCCLSFMRATSI